MGRLDRVEMSYEVESDLGVNYVLEKTGARHSGCHWSAATRVTCTCSTRTEAFVTRMTPLRTSHRRMSFRREGIVRE